MSSTTSAEILSNAYVVTNGGERLEQFKRTFETVGLSPLPKVWNACMIPGEGKLGNSVSHYSLVRMAKETDMPFLVVFEDDAVPQDGAKDALERAFENRKPDCLCLTLGWNYDSDPEVGNDLRKKRKVFGSHAYVLFGREAYDTYLSKWPENGGADIVITRMDGAKRNDEKLFEQHTVGPALHLPHGWAAEQQIEEIVGGEIVEKWKKAREIVAKMKDEKTMHVAYTIDIQGPGAQQFEDQLYVSVKSLRDSRKQDDRIECHIIYANVTVELMERLHALDADGFKVSTIHIENRDMAYWQQFSKYNPKAEARPWGGIVFSRIWLPRFLGKCKRCIYLDADTLVRSSVSDLWSKDLGGKWLGMNMGSVPEYGYNSGVMLMDLQAMRADTTLYDRLEKFMRAGAISFMCPDQTVINRFFSDKIVEIGREWNYPPTQAVSDPALVSARIWHFYNGRQKPCRIDGDDFGKALIVWNRVLTGG